MRQAKYQKQPINIRISLFRLLLTFFVLLYISQGQNPILSSPIQIQTGRVQCPNPVLGVQTSYQFSYISGFTVNPNFAAGISGLQTTLGPIINFQYRTTGSNYTDIFIFITVGSNSSTTISKINFHYIATHPTLLNFTGSSSFTPFFFQSGQGLDWALPALNPIAYGNGDRSWQFYIDRTANANDYSHNPACIPFLMGIVASASDSEYSIAPSCYCANSIKCFLRVAVKKNVQVTFLRMRLVAIDALGLAMNAKIMMEVWISKYELGLPVSTPPIDYLSSNAVKFIILGSFTFTGTGSQWWETIPQNGVNTISTTFKGEFIYWSFTQSTTCPCGLDPPSKSYKCYSGYNNCVLTKKQTYAHATVRTIDVSPSNKWIAMCTNETLEIYKHSDDSTGYSIYQSIYLKTACRSFMFNKDWSLLVLTRVLCHVMFEVFAFNTVSLMWELKFAQPGDYFATYAQYSNIAISDNGQSIVVNEFLSNTLFHFEYNTTTLKYQLVNEEIQNSQVSRVQFISGTDGETRLATFTSEGWRLIVSRKKYKSGKFYPSYELNLNIHNFPTSQSMLQYIRMGLSQDGRVFVSLYVSYTAEIAVFHFDETSNTYLKHSTIRPSVHNFKSVTEPNPQLLFKLDSQGLNMVLYLKDSLGYYMIIYRRASLSQEFSLTQIQRTANSLDSIIDITSEVIALTDIVSSPYTGKLVTYYCSSAVVKTDMPQNGATLLASIVNEREPSDLEVVSKALSDSVSTLQTNYAALNTQVQNLAALQVSDKTALQTLIQQTQQTLQNTITTTKQTLEASILALQTSINTQVQTLTNQQVSDKTSLQTSIQQVSQSLANQIATQKASLQTQITQSAQTLQNSISQNQQTLSSDIQGVKNVNDAQSSLISTNKVSLQASILQTKQTLQATIEQKRQTLEDEITDLRSLLRNLTTQFTALQNGTSTNSAVSNLTSGQNLSTQSTQSSVANSTSENSSSSTTQVKLVIIFAILSVQSVMVIGLTAFVVINKISAPKVSILPEKFPPASISEISTKFQNIKSNESDLVSLKRNSIKEEIHESRGQLNVQTARNPNQDKDTIQEMDKTSLTRSIELIEYPRQTAKVRRKRAKGRKILDSGEISFEEQINDFR